MELGFAQFTANDKFRRVYQISKQLIVIQNSSLVQDFLNAGVWLLNMVCLYTCLHSQNGFRQAHFQRQFACSVIGYHNDELNLLGVLLGTGIKLRGRQGHRGSRFQVRESGKLVMLFGDSVEKRVVLITIVHFNL